MQREDDNALCFGLGVLAGAAAGVLLAVLYAPRSGEETRKTIEDAAGNIVQKYTPEIIDAKHQALESIDVMRYKIERQLDRINAALKAKQLAKAKEKETIDYEVN